MIVVAVIGVLIAIAIPIFSHQLEKAREETDLANIANAKALYVMLFTESDTNAGTYYFDANKGILSATKTGITGYGKGTAKDGGCETCSMVSDTWYTGTTACQGKIIEITLTQGVQLEDISLTLSWVSPS